MVRDADIHSRPEAFRSNLAADQRVLRYRSFQVTKDEKYRAAVAATAARRGHTTHVELSTMHLRRPAAYFHHQRLDGPTGQHAGEDGGGLMLSALLPVRASESPPQHRQTG